MFIKRAQGSYQKRRTLEISLPPTCLELPSPGRLGWGFGACRGGKQHYTNIKEALYICLMDTEKLIKRDEGIMISDSWMALLSHAMMSASVVSSSTYQ